jgi:iron complex transport system substrate-binding protein
MAKLARNPARLLAALAAVLLALSAAASEARTVTDALGREIEAPDKVGRLLALGTSMAFVTYLGAQDLIVAVESVDQLGSVAKPYVVVNGDRFKDLPAVDSGGSARIRNFEEIVKARPDLILLVAAAPSEADDLARKVEIPVAALSTGAPFFDPAVFEASIVLAGELLGREERAREIVSDLAAVKGQLKPPPEGRRAKAYVGGLSSRGNRDLTSTTSASWPMAAAGIDNVMASSGHHGPLFINKEHLILLDPGLLFLDCNGMALIRGDVAKSPKYYQSLSALAEGRAWQVLPHNSYMANVEVNYINALLMAKAAYPELYGDLDPAAAADEVFTAFFGRPVYGYYEENGCGAGRVKLSEGALELIDW